MRLIDKFLGPDTDLAAFMTELFERLPDTHATDEQVDQEFWNRALINPARDILSCSGKGLRARLLTRCWRLAGGLAEQPPEMLPVLIELLHAGSLVIDDIEDDSPMRRGQPSLHRRHGVPIALNTGNWFYFLPLALLSRIDLDSGLRFALYQDISLALLRCHQGQALDLSVHVGSVPMNSIPALVASATRLKTGSLMELSAVIGARAAGASPSRIADFARFGGDLGVGLQMLDDWSGISVEARRAKGIEDLSHGRPTWPWAWLADDPDTFASLTQGLNSSRDGNANEVLDLLRSELASTAPKRIHAHLERTLDELRVALGDSAELGALCQDVEQLEQAYG